MWLGHLDQITAELTSLPQPWIDRATVERVLQVGRRRAQQLLSPCVSFQTGASGLAHRDQFLSHLQQLATGDTAHYERQRRRRLARTLNDLHSNWQTRVPIEAPTSIVNQVLADLPAGIALAPGQITVQFTTTEEVLEKLLSLAMAIGNDLEGFERAVGGREAAPEAASVTPG
jgi:predicted Zn-dependent protease